MHSAGKLHLPAESPSALLDGPDPLLSVEPDVPVGITPATIAMFSPENAHEPGGCRCRSDDELGELVQQQYAVMHECSEMNLAPRLDRDPGGGHVSGLTSYVSTPRV
jgi:hypothetical protein